MRSLRTEAGFSFPAGLGPVFDLRAGRLSAQCRTLLDSASALDDDADIALLDGGPEALAEAVRTGFVRQDGQVPGRLRWSHRLLRQAWYAGLGAEDRVRHHGRIADALEAAPDVDLDRAARHRVLAVHDEASRGSARRACLACAGAAQGRSDFTAASYWLESSIPLLNDDLDRARCPQVARSSSSGDSSTTPAVRTRSGCCSHSTCSSSSATPSPIPAGTSTPGASRPASGTCSSYPWPASSTPPSPHK